jgi:hypothetical protein
VKGAAALEQFEAGGHQTMIAQGRRVVGMAYGVLGDVDRGTEMIADGLSLSETIGDAGGMPLGLCFAGLVHSYATRTEQADAAFVASLRHNRERGQLWAALLAIAHAGVRAVVTGRPADGIRLLTVAERITARSSIALAPRERAAVAEARILAARSLDEAHMSAARTDGEQLGVAEAMTLGIEVLCR